MRLSGVISLLVLCSIFFGCGKNETLEKNTKSLDSLSGALSNIKKHFAESDTVALQKAVLRFTYYSEFISRNITDTLERGEADQLNRFYKAGRDLKNFQKNRLLLIDRIDVCLKQLNDLAKDARNAAMENAELEKNLQVEKAEVGRLWNVANEQQQLFLVSLQDFKNSLNMTDQLIRKRNNGELPQVIKDTINF